MLKRSEVINYFIRRGGYQRYLEIGVEVGETFNEVEAATKIGVDPQFQTQREWLRGESLEATSDTFFNENGTAFDLIFIDGLHTFEQSLRDFTRAMARVSRNGLILLDDGNPSDYLASLRDHAQCAAIKSQEGYPDRNWMGDVFRTVLFIHDYFDNVSFAYIRDTMGIVAAWFEPRAIVPWFQTIEEISRCEFARFKYELLPRLAERSIEEVGGSVFSSLGSAVSDLPVKVSQSVGQAGVAGYEFIEAGPEFSAVLDENCGYSGLVETDTFDGAAYYAEFKKRCQMSQRIGVYRFEDIDVTGAWMLLSRGDYREIYSSLPGMGWEPENIACILEEVKSNSASTPGTSQDQVRTLPGKYVVMSWPGIFTFGHVLVDISIRWQLAKAMGIYAGMKFLIQSPVHAWFLPFLSIAGISIDDCVMVGRNDRVRVEEAYVPTLTGFNGVLHRSAALRAFRRMKESVDNILGTVPKRRNLVFPLHTTMSSSTHPRAAAQRNLIVETLHNRFGVEAFDPLELSFPEQVTKFREARLVLGEDSSAVHNVLWSDGADLAVFAPAGLFNFYHIGIQAINGGRTAIFWGEVIDKESGTFKVDLDSVCRTLDQMLRG